jgi:hypothetical protein
LSQGLLIHPIDQLSIILKVSEHALICGDGFVIFPLAFLPQGLSHSDFTAIHTQLLNRLLNIGQIKRLTMHDALLSFGRNPDSRQIS